MNYLSYINSYRGIAPGKFISRELKKRDIKQNALALSVGEHPQTINAIIAGRRGLTPRLSLEIEKQLNLPEGFLLILQSLYEIKEEKEKLLPQTSGKAPSIRPVVFWDYDFDSIDWRHYKKTIIQRVMERGNDEEKEEILRFYGEKKQ